MQTVEDLTKEFSQINQIRGLFGIITEWTFLFSIIYLYQYLDNMLFYPIVVILIGARQHALGVLCHDIVHRRFLNNKKLADIIGNLFLTWPLFFTIHGFRSMHLRHHQKLNTEEDPDLVRRIGKWDWIFPKTRSELIKLFILDITGLNTFQYFKKLFFYKSDKKLHEEYKKVSVYYHLAQLVYYLCLFLIIYKTNNFSNYLLLWIVPMLTWLKFAKRMRAISEHFAIPKGNYDELTRTVKTNIWGRLLLCPWFINYHVSHHRYPSIPMYNLPAFHKVMLERGELKNWGHISNGYFSDVFKEMQESCSLNSR